MNLWCSVTLLRHQVFFSTSKIKVIFVKGDCLCQLSPTRLKTLYVLYKNKNTIHHFFNLEIMSAILTFLTGKTPSTLWGS